MSLQKLFDMLVESYHKTIAEELERPLLFRRLVSNPYMNCPLPEGYV